MDADKLAKIVRRGTEKLRVDDLVLDTGSEKLSGKGHLRIGRKEIRVSMTLDTGLKPPPRLGAGVVTKSDFWKLSGLIESEVHFANDVGPGFRLRSGRVHTLEFSVNPLVLANHIPTAEERYQKWAKFQKIMGREPNLIDFESREAERQADTSFAFQADFVKYKLHSPNEGTETTRKNPWFGELQSSKSDTLIGETDSCTYVFIQGNKGTDLQFSMRSKSGEPTMNETEHWNKYHALLNGLAFTHGINPWPYRIQYWRGSTKYHDSLASSRSAPRTHHTPFSGLQHNINLPSIISRIATFLEPSTPFNDELSTLLYLFRQAGAKGVHPKVGSLALCSIMESLIKLLCEHLKVASPANPIRNEDFAIRKVDLLKLVNTMHIQDESTLRLRDIVSSAKSTKALKIEEKFKLVCDHLGLQWDGKMEFVLVAWKQLRNSLAHGDFREGMGIPESVFKEDTIAESRVGGGINTMFLKLFGYSGLYKPSVFEHGIETM